MSSKPIGLRLLAPSFSAYAGNPEILAVKKARGPAPADLHPPLITIFATATAELFLRSRLGWVGLRLCEFAHRAARLLVFEKLKLRLHRTARPVIVLDIGVH